VTAGLLKRLAVATLLAGAACARAGDGDLRVLSDEITERGDFGLDLQTGVSRKARDAALEGRGRIDGLVEFSYGLADNWETSLQLPVARQGGRSYAEGTNLEFQFVAPHDVEQGPYVGIRIEFGYAGQAGEKRSWQTEWKPILGYRSGPWHGVFNLGLQAPVSGEDRRVSVEPIVRVVRSISRRSALGFEYQVDLGPLSSPLPRPDRTETLMGVFDTRWHKMDWSFALGKGLNARSPGLTGKLLVEFELDD